MLFEGIVVDTNDPDQDGRVKIYVPSLDGDAYDITNLPWAIYLSPLAGQTLNYPAGSPAKTTSGFASYGFWAIPKEGALVGVICFYNDPNKRAYIGSYFRSHGNRSIPVGRNKSEILSAPVSDVLEPLEPQFTYLKQQFNNQLTSSEAQTRGAYERAVAQDKTDKDGTQGYAKSQTVLNELNPQTVCFTTPGRHSLIFQDCEENARVRLKTANGNQLILDDANERIYLSTAGGEAWMEFDKNGKLCVYASNGIHFSSATDIDFTAVGSFNISAASINLSSTGNISASSCGTLNLSAKTVNITGDSGFNLFSGGDMLLTGSNIHLNGPSAALAECAAEPTVIPTHEPFVRPVSKTPRGKSWKA